MNVHRFISETQKTVLDRNIERGRLAQVWLDKALTIQPKPLFDDHFPDVEDRAEMEAVTRFLVEDGLITEEEWGFSYIEPQCIELNVLHVFVCDGSGMQRVLCVHPGSGRVEVC